MSTAVCASVCVCECQVHLTEANLAGGYADNVVRWATSDTPLIYYRGELNQQLCVTGGFGVWPP